MSWTDYDPLRNWPDDQRYTGKCCDCEQQFFGPKRAPHCWACEQEAERKRQVIREALEAEYGPFVPRSFFGSLTPAQKQAALTYRGNEQHGAWPTPSNPNRSE